MEATQIPTDEFRIDEAGHLVRAVWPTYEDEARVYFGPNPGVIARIRRQAGESVPAGDLFRSGRRGAF